MSQFISKTKTLTLHTKYRLHFFNITKDVEDFVQKSGVATGVIVVQTHHTTCGVWVNEDEKNLIGSDHELGYTSDIKKVIDRFAPPSDEYRHNDVRDSHNPNGKRNTHICEPDERGIIHECMNGHAHAHNLLIQSSLSLIIKAHKIVKGDWQQILVVELDHNRERKVTFLVQGIEE